MQIVYGIIAFGAAAGLIWFYDINLWIVAIVAIAAVVFRKKATKFFLQTGIFAAKKQDDAN